MRERHPRSWLTLAEQRQRCGRLSSSALARDDAWRLRRALVPTANERGAALAVLAMWLAEASPVAEVAA